MDLEFKYKYSTVPYKNSNQVNASGEKNIQSLLE